MIRANKGDEIQVNFYNKLDRRMSIHVQGLEYNVLTSDGAEVGYNPDTTTRDFISYKWYAEREGVYLFSDMGDMRSGEDGTNVHGLFGAIIIEPAASKYYHNIFNIKKNYEEQSVITAPGVESFREFVLFAHNGIRLLDKKGNVIKTTEQGEEGAHGVPDHEDTGEKGYNYRSERFFNRLKRNPIMSKIFSSRAHGDPSTPLLKAYVKERVIIRLLMPTDKPRNISFVLHVHNWRAQPDDPFSTVIPVQGAISVGGVYNIELINGASDVPGDYLYRSGSLRWDVESGMWGIFRVMSRSIRYRCECICRNIGHWWEEQWYDKYM